MTHVHRSRVTSQILILMVPPGPECARRSRAGDTTIVPPHARGDRGLYRGSDPPKVGRMVRGGESRIRSRTPRTGAEEAVRPVVRYSGAADIGIVSEKAPVLSPKLSMSSRPS